MNGNTEPMEPRYYASVMTEVKGGVVYYTRRAGTIWFPVVERQSDSGQFFRDPRVPKTKNG